MNPSPYSALSHLRDAAVDGRLERLGEHLGLELLVAHGGAVSVSPARLPRDLDLAFRASWTTDVLDLTEGLYDITGFENLDLMNLDLAGPVARARALGPASEVLYERQKGLFASEQMAALAMEMDTRWLRRLDLELIAGQKI